MKKLVYFLLTLFVIIYACSEDNTEPEITLRYNLTTEITPSGGGTVSPSSGSYNEGQKITLKATPSSGYIFKNWSGGATETDPSTSVTMSSHKKVTAVFEKEEDAVNQELEDISIINIKNESEFDYWIYGKNGESILVKETNGIPTVAIINNGKSEKLNSIFFDNNGRPSKVIVDGYIFIFENYNGFQLDMAVIDPDGKIEFFKNLEGDVDWDKAVSKSSIVKSTQSTLFKITGWAFKSVACTIATASTIASAGVLWPSMVIPCGNLFIDVITSLAENHEVFENSNTFFESLRYSKAFVKILTCSAEFWLTCTSSFLGSALIEHGNYLEELENRQVDIAICENLLSEDISVATTDFYETFESYNIGTFPTSWTPDANANDRSTNHIDNLISYEGKNSLKLYGKIGGCWGALAYKPIAYDSFFTLEFTVRNGSENLSGCHPDGAYIGLRNGTSWQNDARKLMHFDGDGIVYSSKNTNLGSYNVSEWYKVKIHLEKKQNEIVITYWLNDILIGSESDSIKAFEATLNHIDFTVQEGSAWFDSIKVITDKY